MAPSESRLAEPLRDRLRWQLARSYALVTVAATLVVEAAVLAGVLVANQLELEIGGTRSLLTVLAGTILAITVFSLVVGIGFGYATAQGLTDRLLRLRVAADAWSEGDFAVSIGDEADDELGQLADRLDRMAHELRRLLIMERRAAVSEERDRMARELHDAVKQQLFALSLQIAAVRARAEHGASDVDERLAVAAHLCERAQRELAVIIRELRPSILERASFAEAMREEVRLWARQSNIEADARIAEVHAPPAVELALLRITQEGLANVARHSGACRVDVDLWSEGRAAILSIVDDGRGFDLNAASTGRGLKGMRERVGGLEGAFHLESDSAGTRVIVRVPIPDHHGKAVTETERWRR